VLLPEAFIHSESRHVRQHQGLYKVVRGRLAALYDNDDARIAAPKYVWAVVNVNQGSKYFEIAGTRAAQFTAEANTPFRINGSTGNDKLYTVANVTEVGGNTQIYVSEVIASAVADGNVFLGKTRILKYHTHKKEGTGTEYLLVGTAYHILLWSQSARSLTVKFTCTTPANAENWSFASFQDMVYATNGDDLVQVWDVHASPSGAFANLEGASGLTVGTGVFCTKAKYVYAYEGFLFLGYTYEDALWRPRRVRWCDADDPTTWNENATPVGDQGHRDLMDDEGFVNGFARWSQYMIIAGTKRMLRAWLTTTDTVFRFEKETIELGCLAPDSLVNDKFGTLYFLASDLTIRQLDSAEAIWKPIEQTVKGLNQDAATDARATYYEDFDRILWAVPTGASDTNDLLVEFDPNERQFIFRDMPVSAFGKYTRETGYTWDTLPFPTWEDWDWGVWDARFNSAGYGLLLVADYDGASFEAEQSSTDAGTAIEASLVLGTSLDRRLQGFKRISQPVYFVFQRESAGTVYVYGKRDTESAWRLLGSGSLADSDNPETVWLAIPMDLRARHFAFRIAATCYWELVGVYVPNYEMDGTR
jgi:hypothetical protein